MRNLLDHLAGGGALVDFLHAEARAAGTNLTEVCREAGVNRQTPEQWKAGVPRAVEILISILQTIDKRRAAVAND